MLDFLAVVSLLARVWLKFVLELRLGCLAEFLLWSANIVLSDIISHPFNPHRPVSLHCAFFAQLLARSGSVPSRTSRSTSRLYRFRPVLRCSLEFPSRIARSTSRMSFVSLHVERIAFSAPLLFLSGTVCCVLDDLCYPLSGSFYRPSTVVCCVWFPLRWVCFAWFWFVWSLQIIKNRVQW